MIELPYWNTLSIAHIAYKGYYLSHWASLDFQIDMTMKLGLVICLVIAFVNTVAGIFSTFHMKCQRLQTLSGFLLAMSDA